MHRRSSSACSPPVLLVLAVALCASSSPRKRARPSPSACWTAKPASRSCPPISGAHRSPRRHSCRLGHAERRRHRQVTVPAGATLLSIQATYDQLHGDLCQLRCGAGQGHPHRTTGTRSPRFSPPASPLPTAAPRPPSTESHRRRQARRVCLLCPQDETGAKQGRRIETDARMNLCQSSASMPKSFALSIELPSAGLLLLQYLQVRPVSIRRALIAAAQLIQVGIQQPGRQTASTPASSTPKPARCWWRPTSPAPPRWPPPPMRRRATGHARRRGGLPGDHARRGPAHSEE